MVSARMLEDTRVGAGADQRVFFHGITWKEYEVMLAVRGESSVPRMTYLEGTLELMGPSRTHHSITRTLGRLIEIYAVVHRLPVNGLGSWTLKNPQVERGVEPDECYIVGPDKDVPDIAIEVALTSGGIEKQEVYRKLRVRELWFWQEGRISLFALRGERYVAIDRSEVLPDLDLEELCRFAELPQVQAAIEYDAALRARLAAPKGSAKGTRRRSRSRQ